MYTLFFSFFLFFFYFYFLGWARSAHMGWARPSPAQPGHWPKPVTRLGQSTRAWHCSKAIKLPSRSVLANLKNAKMKKRAYLLLETEDACSADGFSPTASLYLPSALTCLRVPFVFSAAFEAERGDEETDLL
jgi:hypothetical protein